MPPPPRRRHHVSMPHCVHWIGLSGWIALCCTVAGAATVPEQRRAFQGQPLITARPFSFIFNAGDPPRIVWRDLEAVQKLGGDGRLMVRWFNADLREAAVPDRPGRWGAYIEGTAPNGTPVRREIGRAHV